MDQYKILAEVISYKLIDDPPLSLGHIELTSTSKVEDIFKHVHGLVIENGGPLEEVFEIFFEGKDRVNLHFFPNN